MKKIFVLLLTLTVCFSFCACDKDSSTSETTETEQGLTYADVEEWVPGALLTELKYMSDTIDLKQTRYEIGTIEADEDNIGRPIIVAYGRYSTYKKTGQFYKNGTFELRFSYSGELRDDDWARSFVQFD